MPWGGEIDNQDSRLTYKYIVSLIERAYLIARSDDKDPTQNKPFTPEISPKAPPVGPPEVPPHTNTQEHGKKHPPLLGAIEISLCEKESHPKSLFTFHVDMKGLFLSGKWSDRPSDPGTPSQRRTF